MIIPIYKPRGPTSHDIVNQVRKVVGTRAVGHAGTLDPLAEGVLVVGIGREATKKLANVVAKEKEYEATMRLGVASTTDDEEGKKTERAVAAVPECSAVEQAIQLFVGVIEQTPPVYSAVKIAGKEAYKYARAGKPVNVKPRAVEIKKIEVLSYEWPVLKLRVVTGPGVYIRSLARDIGAKLGIGGYLTALIRTRVGEYTLQKSVQLEDLPALLCGEVGR